MILNSQPGAGHPGAPSTQMRLMKNTKDGNGIATFSAILSTAGIWI